MNAVQPERHDVTETNADLNAVSDVEAGIRDFVRNDIAYLRRAPAAQAADGVLDSAAEATVNNANTLIQRVAGATATEIDNLITELEVLRSFMQDEGQRVQRELANFTRLSQTAMKSTRMVADNLAQWKRPHEQQD